MNKLNKKNSKFARAWTNWKNMPWNDKVFLCIVYSVIALITLAVIYPVYWTIIASFSEPYDVAAGEVTLLPSGFTTEAYELIFENKNIWRAYGNTILYTVVGTLWNLFLTLPLAYAWSRKRFFGRSILATFFIITMYFSGGMIPQFILMKNLNLINTRAVLILGGGLSVHNTILVRTYFEHNIPESLFDSARIDGAGEFRVFTSIVLPLSTSIIATVTLYYAVGHWSDWYGAMIYTSNTAIQPLQLVLRGILLKNEEIVGDAAGVMVDAARKAALATTMKFGVVFVSCLPMLVAYPFVQKHFVTGRMSGSVKG